MTGRVVIATALVCALVAAAAAAETDDYSIARYELTAETTVNSPDVRVTLDITYDIRSGTKSSGFKYIGQHQAVGLSGHDGSGEPIAVSLTRQRETRIDWTFPPVVGPARKSVIVTFTIPWALAGTRQSNTFEADWAGVFRVPVARAVYRLVLPDAADRTISGVVGAHQTMRGGRRSVEVEQMPLARQSFQVTFAPGIANGVLRPAITTLGSPVKALLVIGLVVVFFAVLSTSARRSKRDGSWSTSSCAGASSCGGGGGCGGGGCGGGCGG